MMRDRHFGQVENERGLRPNLPGPFTTRAERSSGRREVGSCSGATVELENFCGCATSFLPWPAFSGLNPESSSIEGGVIIGVKDSWIPCKYFGSCCPLLPRPLPNGSRNSGATSGGGAWISVHM